MHTAAHNSDMYNKLINIEQVKVPLLTKRSLLKVNEGEYATTQRTLKS